MNEKNESKEKINILISFTLTQVQRERFDRASRYDSAACGRSADHFRFRWHYGNHGNVLRCMINVYHRSALDAAQLDDRNRLRVRICLFK